MSGWRSSGRSGLSVGRRPDGTAARDLRRVVRQALEEDLGAAGDVTTRAVVPQGANGVGRILTREPCVCAGVDYAVAVYRHLDPTSRILSRVGEGRSAGKGACLLAVRASLHALLSGERVALNFVGRMSGIATLTRRYVEAVAGTKARILDTRKTTPLLREAERAAVRAGGGMNHRSGLYDAVLIKDNHVRAAGSLRAAVRLARQRADGRIPIMAEAETPAQMVEACREGAGVVLLDNMGLRDIRRAVALARSRFPRVRIEVSGGMTPGRARRVARLGVDRISVGALTHSARSINAHMEIVPAEPRGRRV
ncbi:MAG: carboxylating nicotinate-nucleotide diphosphorylase [Nitrospirae bacterium]|nr:carboxylating nicotinate-nucleotide diphosphorylase [Nitrospirota bacterium]